jgi:argininosuccinate lyase
MRKDKKFSDRPLHEREESKIMGHLWHCYDHGVPIDVNVGFMAEDGRVDDRCLAILVSDYLVIKWSIGLRDAYAIAARLSTYLQEEDKMFYELELEEWNQFGYKRNNHLFGEDIFNVMKLYMPPKLTSGETDWKKLLEFSGEQKSY